MTKPISPAKTSPELLRKSAEEVQRGDRPAFNIADSKNASPRRSAAWRYERAVRLLDSDTLLPHKVLDDRWTKMLYRFLSTHRELQNELADPDMVEFYIQRKFPTLWTAYEIFSNRENNPMKYTLESRILARQEDEDIAKRMPVAAEVVNLYEQMFYRVRDRLDYSDFIATAVIGPVFRVGSDSVTPELIAKYFGYFCGPIVLDYVLQAFSQGHHPKSDTEVVEFVERHAITAIKTQAAIMSTVMLPTKFNFKEVMDGFLQLINIERSTQGGTGDGQANYVTKLVEAIRSGNPIPRGDSAKKLVDKVPTHYASGYVELRAHEKQVAANVGAEAIANIEHLKQIRPPVIEGDLRVVDQSKPKPGS